jgi:hypothetical protein
MIVVYWSTRGNAGLRANAPSPALPLAMLGRDKKELSYINCPAFKDAFTNVIGVHSYYSYRLRQTEGGGLESDTWDQKFFDKNVVHRSSKESLHSFIMPYIFFTEEDSLEVKVTPSYFEDNDFNSTSILVPGLLDIGKYFRNLECAFHIRKGQNTMKMKEGDVFMYLSLDTSEKVVYKEFLWSPELDRYLAMVLEIKDYRVKNFKPLNYFYAIFKKAGLKRRIMQEIRNNLCEEVI